MTHILNCFTSGIVPSDVAVRRDSGWCRGCPWRFGRETGIEEDAEACEAVELSTLISTVSPSRTGHWDPSVSELTFESEPVSIYYDCNNFVRESLVNSSTLCFLYYDRFIKHMRLARDLPEPSLEFDHGRLDVSFVPNLSRVRVHIGLQSRPKLRRGQCQWSETSSKWRRHADQSCTRDN